MSRTQRTLLSSRRAKMIDVMVHLRAHLAMSNAEWITEKGLHGLFRYLHVSLMVEHGYLLKTTMINCGERTSLYQPVDDRILTPLDVSLLRLRVQTILEMLP